MDDEEYENFKAREAHLDEFKDNSKDMDVDKGRSITDDFEQFIPQVSCELIELLEPVKGI